MRKVTLSLFIGILLTIFSGSCCSFIDSNSKNVNTTADLRVLKLTKNQRFVTKLAKRTVRIKSEYICNSTGCGKKILKFSGTGTIIYSGNGYSLVLTATHVVDKSINYYNNKYKLISVKTSHYNVFNNKPEGYYPAIVVSSDKIHDIALLRVSVDYKVNTKINNKNYIGTRIHVLGFPSNPLSNKAVYSYSTGVISAIVYKQGNIGPWLKYSAATYFGNSGGGIFNNDGTLVGVVNFLYARYRIPINGYYYGCSSSAVIKFLKSCKYAYLLEINGVI